VTLTQIGIKPFAFVVFRILLLLTNNRVRAFAADPFQAISGRSGVGLGKPLTLAKGRAAGKKTGRWAAKEWHDREGDAKWLRPRVAS
jgi:hypothetical protein